jgi:hypothetical protein
VAESQKLEAQVAAAAKANDPRAAEAASTEYTLLQSKLADLTRKGTEVAWPPSDVKTFTCDHFATLSSSLRMLVEPHRFREDGVSWRLQRLGVEVQGQGSPRTTGGLPETIIRIWRKFGPSIRTASERYQVPVELLLADIATESGGRPDAEQLEPDMSQIRKHQVRSR